MNLSSIIGNRKEGDVINSDLIGALLAFSAGVVIATVNYAFSKYVIKNYPDKYAGAQAVRSILHIGFLFAIFVFGKHLPWSVTYLLIGGCLGVTLPMVFFTAKLVKYNDSLNGKGGSADG